MDQVVLFEFVRALGWLAFARPWQMESVHSFDLRIALLAHMHDELSVASDLNEKVSHRRLVQVGQLDPLRIL